MKLFFTCPEKQIVFETADYSLEDGYQVKYSEPDKRVLAGRVRLHSKCPLCGKFHSYKAEEISCPYDVQKR